MMMTMTMTMKMISMMMPYDDDDIYAFPSHYSSLPFLPSFLYYLFPLLFAFPPFSISPSLIFILLSSPLLFLFLLPFVSLFFPIPSFPYFLPPFISFFPSPSLRSFPFLLSFPLPTPASPQKRFSDRRRRRISAGRSPRSASPRALPRHEEEDAPLVLLLITSFSSFSSNAVPSSFYAELMMMML